MPITAVRRAGALPVAGHLSPASALSASRASQLVLEPCGPWNGPNTACSGSVQPFPGPASALPPHCVFLLSGFQSFLERSKGCDLKVAESLQPGPLWGCRHHLPSSWGLGGRVGVQRAAVHQHAFTLASPVSYGHAWLVLEV